MDSLSPIRRFYYACLSRAYALMYSLNRRTLLGFRLNTLVRWTPILFLAFGWLRRWPLPIIAVLLLASVWINYSLWRAKRDNYNRFIPDAGPMVDIPDPVPLPPNQKVAVLATGLFSVSGRENTLLLRPAQYWRVPLGDHIIMVEEQTGKYLYQFFDAPSLQDVRRGWLLFGPKPVETLAISFLARWGPEYTRFGQLNENGVDDDLPPPKRVTVYLTIGDEDIRRAIWHTIVSEARRARLGEI